MSSRATHRRSPGLRTFPSRSRGPRPNPTPPSRSCSAFQPWHRPTLRRPPPARGARPNSAEGRMSVSRDHYRFSRPETRTGGGKAMRVRRADRPARRPRAMSGGRPAVENPRSRRSAAHMPGRSASRRRHTPTATAWHCNPDDSHVLPAETSRSSRGNRNPEPPPKSGAFPATNFDDRPSDSGPEVPGPSRRDTWSTRYCEHTPLSR